MRDNILVPLDGSRIAEAALPHAAALGRLLGARVTLARVPETLLVPVASVGVWLTRVVETEEAVAEARNYLAGVAGSPVLADVAVTTLTPDPPVAFGLLGAIADSAATLVTMTSHGHSAAGRWVFGSVALKLVRASPVGVYVVRAPAEALGAPDTFTLPAPPVFSAITVPLDGSPLAATALEPASRLAKAAGATLHLVTVPTVPGYLKVIPETAGAIPEALRERAAEAQADLESAVKRLAAAGVTATADVELIFSGTVEDGILEHAARHGADLIVLSTHGRGGLQRWLLGSTAERLLAASRLPVWVHRA
jgi:nucleotide-binding universal stress UspA family protein